MSIYTKFSKLIIIMLLVFVWMAGSLVAQEQLLCMFISETLDPDPRDVNIYNWLLATYDVTIDIATGDEVAGGFYSTEDFKSYDFIFVSESISSNDTRPLKGAPTPIFYTELWSSKWDVTGWVPTNTSGTYYENTVKETGNNIVKIVDGDHPLAAGFNTGDEITIVTDANDDGSGNFYYLTYSVPGVEHIPIAVLSTNEERKIVLGVEAGTSLYNAENVNDGSLLSESRCAAVGINANANEFMTDDAFTLIQAGIDWILEPALAVEDDISIAPSRFQLEQNYPNPFNPTTHITFSLEKAAHTTLTVYNVLGEEIDVVIDASLKAGEHSITYNASHLMSGVYFYNLISDGHSMTQKMMLIK
jgi:hypothetical protein